MGAMTLQNVPDDLIRAIERRAKQEQITIDDEAVKIMQRGIDESSRDQKRAWPANLKRKRFMPPRGSKSVVEMLREDRAR